MLQRWPVKVPIQAYAERLRPTEPLITKVRIIDTFFPVARGGTYCIPGPFGAGKTVLQQITSRHAEVDIVVIAACGERAGEVVETLREFPELTDPRTGRSLMDRTVIICNTSSMPVAAREASVYTAVTIADYYRQMGLNVLLLADSTSRWAQALRETSGRLEEIPGEEAFPAYLESVIASFYERGGVVRLKDGAIGSITIGGTVSPAGGNFDEPVTQATLKVVGAFHGLSRARSDARRYPAIDPLDSWSKYPGVVPAEEMARPGHPAQGNEVRQMMKVVGEEGTSMEDFIVYLKAEYLDAVYLQQDAFDPVDGARRRSGSGTSSASSPASWRRPWSSRTRRRRAGSSTSYPDHQDWNRAEMDTGDFRASRRGWTDGGGGSRSCVRSITASKILRATSSTIHAKDVNYRELAEVTSPHGASLAQVIRLRDDQVSLQVSPAPGASRRTPGAVPGPSPCRFPSRDALLGRIFTGGGSRATRGRR